MPAGHREFKQVGKWRVAELPSRHQRAGFLLGDFQPVNSQSVAEDLRRGPCRGETVGGPNRFLVELAQRVVSSQRKQSRLFRNGINHQQRVIRHAWRSRKIGTLTHLYWRPEFVKRRQPSRHENAPPVVAVTDKPQRQPIRRKVWVEFGPRRVDSGQRERLAHFRIPPGSIQRIAVCTVGISKGRECHLAIFGDVDKFRRIEESLEINRHRVRSGLRCHCARSCRQLPFFVFDRLAVDEHVESRLARVNPHDARWKFRSCQLLRLAAFSVTVAVSLSVCIAASRTVRSVRDEHGNQNGQQYEHRHSARHGRDFLRGNRFQLFDDRQNRRRHRGASLA